MRPQASVWYLGHSGFAVGINGTLLIFDYYLDHTDNPVRSLASGVINPDEIKGKKVIVFSSHRHPDHFNPVILSWKESLSDIRYFLSSDIPKRYHHEGIQVLKPYETYEDTEIKVQTFKSTDEGVAFLVTLNGLVVYHAGDLNWWHWEEENKAWNNNMAARFKYEVALIKEYPVDLAFLTADPRQEKAELWGIRYFLENVEVGTAFPMHFSDDMSLMNRIKKESLEIPALLKVQPIQCRGELFSLNPNP